MEQEKLAGGCGELACELMGRNQRGDCGLGGWIEGERGAGDGLGGGGKALLIPRRGTVEVRTADRQNGGPVHEEREGRFLQDICVEL